MCAVEGCDLEAFCRGWCAKHYTRWQRHGDPLVTSRTPPMDPDDTEKLCPKCQTSKPLDAYDSRKGTKNRVGALKGYCRECSTNYDAEHAKTGKGKEQRRQARAKWNGHNHEYFLQWRYGISAADYEAMLAAQGGRCAVCGTDTPGKTNKVWSVDHCHENGHVRGLLCSHCNTGLGYFRDSVDALHAAIDYLKRTSP